MEEEKKNFLVEQIEIFINLLMERKNMFRAKDLRTFEQLERLMGNDETVNAVSYRYKKLGDYELQDIWRTARKMLKSNGLSSPYPNPTSAIPYVKAAIEIACARKEFNRRRDEELEVRTKRELEKVDDDTIYECARICEPEHAEMFRRIGRLYRKLKKLRKRFGRREYRWEYESTRIQYHRSRKMLLSIICNYLLHPTRAKTYGEYGSSWPDVKIVVARNRSKIRGIKRKILKKLRLCRAINDLNDSLEANLKYQNIHQSKEKEDIDLIRKVVLGVCPHDHDIRECPNFKAIKKVLNHPTYFA